MIVFTFIGIAVVVMALFSVLNKEERTSINKRIEIKDRDLAEADTRKINKRIWFDLLKDECIDDEFKKVITDFFLTDNIDYKKYYQNERANEKAYGYGLELWEDSNRNISINPEKEINCTSTFREHFSNNTLNRGMSTPSWFYIAYPDVAFWFHKNHSEFEKEMELREAEFIDESGLKIIFFRELIDRFKLGNGKLECS